MIRTVRSASSRLAYLVKIYFSFSLFLILQNQQFFVALPFLNVILQSSFSYQNESYPGGRDSVFSYCCVFYQFLLFSWSEFGTSVIEYFNRRVETKYSRNSLLPQQNSKKKDLFDIVQSTALIVGFH